MAKKTEQMDWKCHTPKLLQEVLNNPGTSALQVPLNILLRILAEVAQRAIELDDSQMNYLMMRLTLYGCADPTCEDYDPKAVKKCKLDAEQAIAKAKKK